MSIQEWFKSGCNYQEGVKLYEVHGRNKNLIRLFRRGNDKKNVQLLHYELNKILRQSSDKSRTPVRQVSDKKPTRLIVNHSPRVLSSSLPSDQMATQPSEELKKMKSKPISFYPVVLHPVYHQRINSFLQACSLKMKLNELPEDEVEKAFELQFQIFNLFELNDKCWTILRHYEDTGRIMPLKSSEDYSKLNPGELFRMQQNLYSRISKRKKTIDNKEKELNATKEPGKIARLEQTIIEKKEELQQLENDIAEISRLMNK